MAVRELLRLDTSAHHQSSLNCVTVPQLPPPATQGEGEGASGSAGDTNAASDCSIQQDSGLDQGVELEELGIGRDFWVQL